MKLFYPILIGLLLLSSCKNTATDKDNQSSEAPVATNNSVAPPSSLNQLFNPNKGVFRGIDFSSTMPEVQAAEKAETANSNNENKYSIDLNDTDFADIEYLFEAGKLQKIQVDIFSKNAQTYKDITDFFNQKYKQRKSLWEGNENGNTYTVYAKQVKNGIYLVYELL